MCGLEEYLCVHHLTYENYGHEKPEDLITLCRGCHYKVHKLNKELTFVSYESNKEYEEAMEKLFCEFDAFALFIETHIEQFDSILEIIDKQNYIHRKIFNKAILKINDYFDRVHFNFFSMDYFDLVYVTTNDKSKIKKQFPSNSPDTPFIVRKSFYRKHKDRDLYMVGRIYSWETLNPFTAFQEFL